MFRRVILTVSLLSLSCVALAERVSKQCWPLDMGSINLQGYVDSIKNPSGGNNTYILNLGENKIINVPNLLMFYKTNRTDNGTKGGVLRLALKVSAEELFYEHFSILTFADDPEKIPLNSKFGKKTFFSENQKVLDSNERASDLGCKYDSNYMMLGNYSREDYEPEPDEAQSIVGYLLLQMIESQHFITYDGELKSGTCHAPLSTKEHKKLLERDLKDYQTGKTFTVMTNFIEAELSDEKLKVLEERKLLLPYLNIPSSRYGVATVPLYSELTRNGSSDSASSYVVSPPIQTRKSGLAGYGTILFDLQGVEKRHVWLQENGYVKTNTEVYKEHYAAETWEQKNPSHCFNRPVKLVSYKESSPTLFVMDANPNLWKHMIDSLMVIYTPTQEEIDNVKLDIYQGDIEKLKKHPYLEERIQEREVMLQRLRAYNLSKEKAK